MCEQSEIERSTGDILIFNNGLKRPGGEYSSVEEITPPADSDGR